MTKSREAVRRWEDRREEAAAARGRHRCATILYVWRRVSSLEHRSHRDNKNQSQERGSEGPCVWDHSRVCRDTSGYRAKGASGGRMGKWGHQLGGYGNRLRKMRASKMGEWECGGKRDLGNYQNSQNSGSSGTFELERMPAGYIPRVEIHGDIE